MNRKLLQREAKSLLQHIGRSKPLDWIATGALVIILAWPKKVIWRPWPEWLVVTAMVIGGALVHEHPVGRPSEDLAAFLCVHSTHEFVSLGWFPAMFPERLRVVVQPARHASSLQALTPPTATSNDVESMRRYAGCVRT